MTLPPTGVYTPLPTFFKADDDYSLDIDTQLKHADYIHQAGVSGVLIGGSNGEAVNLTKKERHSIVKAVRERVDDSFVILAGTVGQSISDVVTDISELKALGANYAVILVPGYFANLTNQQGLIDWFTAIADKSLLPIIIYNYPGVQNGIDLTFDSYITLSQHPNIVGCKLTHYNFPLYTLLGQSQQLKDNNFRVLAGVGQVFLPGLSVGVEGCIDGLSNVFPKCMVQIWNLYSQGKLEEAQKLQALVTKVNEMTAVLNLLGLKYAIKHILGVGEVHGRPPLNQPIDLKVWEKYLPDFNELWAIEKSL
ncbi:putative L-threo-3-deoxy-hexylosonate aldolase [[Candida] jaroonii]|uniref:L-threo-3-deoxy-hexylosonate aldolase n=1 Tax=[Candida] jaroonii TaxID=467808 RepID=A0ACA9YF57_9ASCO|nr:putative L-threo-3-deoxy-hexylosonate aldolase [[Candida] jaroonii]